ATGWTCFPPANGSPERTTTRPRLLFHPMPGAFQGPRHGMGPRIPGRLWPPFLPAPIVRHHSPHACGGWPPTPRITPPIAVWPRRRQAVMSGVVAEVGGEQCLRRGGGNEPGNNEGRPS